MDYRLQQVITDEATRGGLRIHGDFYQTLDSYVDRHFRFAPDRNKLVIQTYLARAAIRIALTEGKTLLEPEDAKAAVWLFHLPEQPDDPCAAAGNRALVEEGRRIANQRGLLTDAFALFLNRL